jgi:hypothetical protein
MFLTTLSARRGAAWTQAKHSSREDEKARNLLTESGSIGDVRIVRDTPGLARHTENVARTWKFLPAMRNRAAANGSVIVVAWYLRPILFNNPPDVGGAYYPYEPSQPAIFRDGGPKPRGF